MSKSYSELLDGAAAFQKNLSTEHQELFADLSNKQIPKVALLTCSDSRIDPTLVTQSGPGDLFVLRNAGNIAPSAEDGVTGETASFEFAVQGLKVEKLVVCGHSDCGAMKAVINPSAAASLKYIPDWVASSAGLLDEIASIEDPGEKLNALIRANVMKQLDKLREFDFVRDAEAEGRLSLHGWYFDIGKGAISEIPSSASVA